MAPSVSRVPAEHKSANDIIAELDRIDGELCNPDAVVDELITAVAGLDANIRAAAPGWAITDGQRVLHRFNAVLALAVERRATVLTAIEHQTSGRRAVARYQAR